MIAWWSQHMDPSTRVHLARWLSELPPEILGARSLRPVQRWLSDVAHRQHSPDPQVSTTLHQSQCDVRSAGWSMWPIVNICPMFKHAGS